MKVPKPSHPPDLLNQNLWGGLQGLVFFKARKVIPLYGEVEKSRVQCP